VLKQHSIITGLISADADGVEIDTIGTKKVGESVEKIGSSEV